jgi:outer membrane protein TolC
MKKLLLFVLFWGVNAAADAQNSAILDEYIRVGLTNNLSLQQREYDVRKTREAIRQARALFQPNVQFNATYTLAAGGRRIDFPIGDLLNPVYSTLNQLTQSNAFPSLENQQINFLPNNFQETKLKVSYPLYNSDLKYNRQIQEHLATSQVAQKAALEQELRGEMTSAYLQYLQALEAEKIWQTAKITLSELRRFNESLVKNNVATRDVVATAEYELSKAEQEIFKLKSQQNTARAYFNFLIGNDLQGDVQIDSTLLRGVVPVYSREALIQQALNGRQEFAALNAGKAAASSALDLQDANRRLPDLYVGGEVGFQGFGYHFADEQAYGLVQLGLTYDLWNGGANRSKVQEAKISAEKMNLQINEVQRQVALQVTSAWNDLEAARQVWYTNQQGQRAAEETFRIVNNKYRAGQALLLEYTDAQNRVTTARLQVLLSWVDVLVKDAELRKVAGL